MIVEYLMQNLGMFKNLFMTLEGSFEIRPSLSTCSLLKDWSTLWNQWNPFTMKVFNQECVAIFFLMWTGEKWSELAESFSVAWEHCFLRIIGKAKFSSVLMTSKQLPQTPSVLGDSGFHFWPRCWPCHLPQGPAEPLSLLSPLLILVYTALLWE